MKGHPVKIFRGKIGLVRKAAKTPVKVQDITMIEKRIANLQAKSGLSAKERAELAGLFALRIKYKRY